MFNFFNTLRSTYITPGKNLTGTAYLWLVPNIPIPQSLIVAASFLVSGSEFQSCVISASKELLNAKSASEYIITSGDWLLDTRVNNVSS